MKIFPAKSLTFLVALLVSIILQANLALAADSKESSEYYEKALDAFNQQDFESSYIFLKNSLQSDEDNLPAKILMGRVLMVSGYLEEAETEFLEALTVGADPNLVADPLGKTWLFLGKNEEIINKKFRGLEKENAVDWQIIKATANLNLKNIDAARKQYLEALNVQPSNTRVLNALAALELQELAFSAAQRFLTRSFAQDSENANTWRIQGELYLKQGKHQLATEALEKGFEINEFDPVVTRSLVSAHLQQKNSQRAREILNKILKQTPDDPIASLINAWLLAADDNSEKAKSELDRLSANLASVSEDELAKRPDLIYVAALSSFAQNNFEQARTFFTQYLTVVPNNLEAINLLAQTLVKLGQTKAALEVMQRHERHFIEKLDSALLLGTLYLSNNKAFKTLELIYRLKQQFRNNKRVELLEIKTLIARDKFEDAMSNLNKSEHISSDISFILTKSMLLLEMGEFEQANDIADRLLEIAPESNDFINYKVAVLIKMKKWSEAQPLVEKLLSVDPQHFSARFNQATILIADNQFQSAFDIASVLHTEQPDNLSALLLLSRTQAELGLTDEAIENLLKAVDKDIDNRMAHELLTSLYINKGDLDKALRHVNALINDDPTAPKYQLQRAELYYLRKQNDRALREVGKIQELVADMPALLINLAKLQLQMKEFNMAKQSVTRASELLPQNRFVSIEYIKTHIAARDFSTAETKLSELQKTNKDDPELTLFSGNIFVAKGQLEEAFKAYFNALTLAPNYRLALAKMYQLTLQGIGHETFSREIAKLVEAQPENYFQRNLLADHYLNQGQFDKALPHYEILEEIQTLPNKAFIYNNLANIYLNKDSEKALAYIDKAMQINSNEPAVLDTYGWIKTLNGEHNQALDILRRAYAMDSNNPSIMYHLGFTLNKLGRLEEAKQELAQSLASDKMFFEREEAQALYDSI